MVEHETALVQIFNITNIEIDPILKMDEYIDTETMSSQLGRYDSEKEKNEFVKSIGEETIYFRYG